MENNIIMSPWIVFMPFELKRVALFIFLEIPPNVCICIQRFMWLVKILSAAGVTTSPSWRFTDTVILA